MIRIQRQSLLYNVPLIFALVITFVSVLMIERSVMLATGGVFMYPLDDPFIHMEIAGNLAASGTWGVNPGEFASASSSLLYTVMLALLFKLFSVHVVIPFILNCIAAFILLIVVDKWFRKQGTGMLARLVILGLVVFFLPLPVMIISGMEHTLQCLFSFLFITTFADWVVIGNGTAERKWKLPVSLLVYAFLVTAIRYEGIFLVAVAGLILLWQRKIKASFILGAMALLPVALFGIYSLSKGSYFFPNPLFIKSEEFQLSVKGILNFFSNMLINKFTVTKTTGSLPGVPPPGISLLTTQRILIILPLVSLFFAKQLRQASKYNYIVMIITLTTLLHLAFASTGWFYRYEAYLVMNACVISFFIMGRYWKELLPDKLLYTRLLAGILFFALFFPFVLRSSAAFTKAKQACVNIYEQQYQMGQFLHKYYPETAVAANDIGAISFFTKAEVIDLWGLGSIEVARSRKNKSWTPEFLDSFVRDKQVGLAIVYDEWFDKRLLQRWNKVATWQISDNVITGGDTVSFYSIDSTSGQELRRNIAAFEPLLPKKVKVVYTIPLAE